MNFAVLLLKFRACLLLRESVGDARIDPFILIVEPLVHFAFRVNEHRRERARPAMTRTTLLNFFINLQERLLGCGCEYYGYTADSFDIFIFEIRRVISVQTIATIHV